MENQSKIRILCTCGVLIAIAQLLSYIVLYEFPNSAVQKFTPTRLSNPSTEHHSFLHLPGSALSYRANRIKKAISRE